jgi:hypothetical protein
VIAARLRSPEVVNPKRKLVSALMGLSETEVKKKRNVRTAVGELLCEVVLQSRKPGNEARILF